MQSVTPSINLYDRSILEHIRTRLHHFGPEAFEMFQEGPIGVFLHFRWGTGTTRALHHLLAREVEIEGVVGEFWFCFGGTNIRFGIPEFALMTELSFADSGYDVTQPYDMPEFSCLSYYQGRRPSIDELHNDFKNTEIDMSDSVGDYVKIANLLFAYRMLGCLDEKRLVDAWACALVEEADGWLRFPWGSWSYNVFLYQMDQIFTSSD